jgi:long-chain acyl-CoA synthetase
MSAHELEDAVQSGMLIAYHADRTPDVSAVASEYGERTFAELNANANRLVRLLARHGIGAGDSVAIVARNRPEFIETLAATTRSGIRFTPINFHLKGEEIGYIVDNCEATAFVADATLGPPVAEAVQHAPNLKLKLSLGGEADGFLDFNDAIAGFDGSDIENPTLGSRMLYTSGTTGRPKGVYRKARLPEAPVWGDSPSAYTPGTDRELVTGPAYHAAPLLIDIVQPLWSGVGIVMMDRWDAEHALRLIHEHKITHTHMVATMFHRLLQLPAEVRAKYAVDSLKFLIHGAAPCPVHIKQSIIDWFGPVVWEYYAATEGGGGFLVGSEEWLTKPGTVGRPGPEFDNKILDDNGQTVATGEIGTIYMRAPEFGRFEYYKDGAKTGKS